MELHDQIVRRSIRIAFRGISNVIPSSSTQSEKGESMYQKLALVVIFALGLGGCASVPMGDPKEDAAAKEFKAKPKVSGLYIYRNESMGAAVKMDVEVDGKMLGESAAQTYFYTEVAPGKHTVTSKAENTDTLEINTVAGKLYYIWQEVKMGFLYARTQLHLVNETEGQKGVRESKLAAMKK